MEDTNNKDVVYSSMNVGALSTKYAEYLSTLNAGQVVNKVNAQSDYYVRPRDEERRKPNNKTNGGPSGSQVSQNGKRVHKNGMRLPSATAVVK